MRGLFVAVAVAGCAASPLPTTCVHDGEIRRGAHIATSADLLFVVDGSPATAPYRARLDAELPTLVAALMGSAQPWVASWHVAVVVADADGPLAAMDHALRSGVGVEAGFLRASASLGVVFVSAVDDDDASAWTRAATLLAAPAVVGGVKFDPHDVVAAALTPPTAERIRALATSASQAVVADLDGDWTAPLRQLGDDLVVRALPCVTRYVADPTGPQCTARDVVFVISRRRGCGRRVWLCTGCRRPS